jgi:hypothetical protein
MRTMMFDAASMRTRYTTHVGIFDCISDLTETIASRPHWKDSRELHSYNDGFHGDLSMAEACDRAISGDTKLAAIGDKYLSDIEGQLVWPSRRIERVAGPVGTSLHFGNYLAGTPDVLYRHREAENDLAPLTIVMDTMSWSGITNQQLQMRGAALLALTRYLADKRAVTLYIAGTTLQSDCHSGLPREQNSIALVKLDTAPLSVAHAAFMMVSPSSHRKLIWAGTVLPHRGLRENSSWPFFDRDGTGAPAKTGRIIQAALGLKPEDTLYIPYARRPGDMEDDPVAWVVDKINTYGRLGEAAETD